MLQSGHYAGELWQNLEKGLNSNPIRDISSTTLCFINDMKAMLNIKILNTMG